MAYYSVIIPTYNRAHLLPMAIRSVLQQTFADFEIVVSNGGSTDNTREVVQQFNEPRIKYLESEVRLSIGDNYQTGLENAHGEYITFLSDDDAYSPTLLERAKQVVDDHNAEIVGYPSSRYYHDDLFDQQLHVRKNTLYIPRFDGEVTRFDSTDAREQVRVQHAISDRALHPKFVCPYLANGVYHQSIFERLKQTRSKLFESVPADMYLAMAVFYVAKSYHCLDVPLHIWSNWAGNATVSPDRSKNTIRQHYERLLDGKPLDFTPLKYPLPLNCGVNAVLQASNDFGAGNGRSEPTWKTYYIAMYTELMSLKRLGVNVDNEVTEFRRVLSQQPSELRKAVDSEIESTAFKLKEISREYPTLSRVLKKIFHVGRVSEASLVKGEQEGFGNVLESAEYAGRRFR